MQHYYYNHVVCTLVNKVLQFFLIKVKQIICFIQLDIPGKPPLQMATPEIPKFNDGKWHSVAILHQKISGQDQLNMAVDGIHSSYSYSGIDQLNFQGLLYVGKLSLATECRQIHLLHDCYCYYYY